MKNSLTWRPLRHATALFPGSASEALGKVGVELAVEGMVYRSSVGHHYAIQAASLARLACGWDDGKQDMR